jgi:hypothetical protein
MSAAYIRLRARPIQFGYRFSWLAILESVGVLVGLFYATILLLSLWYSLRPITPVFTLSVDPPNWDLGARSWSSIRRPVLLQIGKLFVSLL